LPTSYGEGQTQHYASEKKPPFSCPVFQGEAQLRREGNTDSASIKKDRRHNLSPTEERREIVPAEGGGAEGSGGGRGGLVHSIARPGRAYIARSAGRGGLGLGAAKGCKGGKRKGGKKREALTHCTGGILTIRGNIFAPKGQFRKRIEGKGKTKELNHIWGLSFIHPRYPPFGKSASKVGRKNAFNSPQEFAL